MTSSAERAAKHVETEPDDVEIAPDDKDWTWVLKEQCPDCGFDVDTVAGRAVASRLRACAR